MDVREKLVELSDSQVLQREMECVKRKSATNCTDCLNCDLLMTDERILTAYKNAIDALQNAHGVTVQEWISVKDRLPEDGETVLIWSGGCHVATIEKGITEEERRMMKNGELPDPEETGWTLSSGYFTTKRSRTYTRADVFGNNKVPYCWNGVNSPMNWFGQDVTHWMPLPQPPKGDLK